MTWHWRVASVVVGLVVQGQKCAVLHRLNRPEAGFGVVVVVVNVVFVGFIVLCTAAAVVKVRDVKKLKVVRMRWVVCIVMLLDQRASAGSVHIQAGSPRGPQLQEMA